MIIHRVNRYGHSIEVEQIDDSHWLIACPASSFSRCGGEPEKISFWDPEGGPFIGLSMNLRELSSSLPDSNITEIMLAPLGGVIVTVSHDKIESQDQ